jgi:preprotein translocase subunit SecG
MGIYIFVSVLVIIACVFQIMIVLVQNSKGGGLAANFTSAGQSMGIATASIPRGSAAGHSRIENQIQNAVDPNAIPTLPTAVPPSTSTNNNTPSGGDKNPAK